MKLHIKNIGWIAAFSLLGLALLILASLHANLEEAHARQTAVLTAALTETAATLHEHQQRFAPTHPHAEFRIHKAGDSRVTKIPHFAHQLSDQRFYNLNSTAHLPGGNKREFGILIRYFPLTPAPCGGTSGNVYEVIWSEGKRISPFVKMADFPDSSRMVKTGAGVQIVGATENYTIELVDDGRAQ